MRNTLEADPAQLGIFAALGRLEANLSRRLKAMEKKLDNLQSEFDETSEKVGKINTRSKDIRDKIMSKSAKDKS